MAAEGQYVSGYGRVLFAGAGAFGLSLDRAAAEAQGAERGSAAQGRVLHAGIARPRFATRSIVHRFGSKHLRLVPPAKVFPWDHPSSDQAVQLVCRTEPTFHSFEQARPF